MPTCHARRWGAALLALAVVAGCGGSPDPDRPSDQATSGAEADQCAPDEARLGGACWSAAGSRWRVQADGPAGEYRFELSLLAAGRVRATDHAGASPAHDEWFQDGPLLRVFLSDRFVEYRARVTNGTVIIGEAINVRGQRWSWRADRQFGELACDGGDAQTEEGCLTVAGTRWRLEADGSDARVIEFLDDAELASGSSRGQWEQAGSAVTFTLEEGGPEYIALVEGSRELTGRFAGGGQEGLFRATRVPSIPPVMHE